MSRWTWLKATDVAAVTGMDHRVARKLTAKLDKHSWSYQHVRVQTSALVAHFEQIGVPLPPLLLALMADEREYPLWLAELSKEYRAARKQKKVPRKDAKPARVSVARDEEEVREVLEALPDIEARGYLDDGLPPEYRMEDRLGLARAYDGDDDG